jgi:hypothetical protein
MRDLVRARESAAEDQRHKRQLVSAFMLRHGRLYHRSKPWKIWCHRPRPRRRQRCGRAPTGPSASVTLDVGPFLSSMLYSPSMEN